MPNNRKPPADATPKFGLPSLLTKQQAADYLQVSTRYLERLIVGGRLRAYKPTVKTLRLRLADLDALLESSATMAA